MIGQDEAFFEREEAREAGTYFDSENHFLAEVDLEIAGIHTKMNFLGEYW